MGKRSWTFNHQVRNFSFPTWVLLNDMSGQLDCHMPTCCCCWFSCLEALLRIRFVLSRDLSIGNSRQLSWQDFNAWFDDALLSTSVCPAIHPSIHAFYLTSNLLSIYLLLFFPFGFCILIKFTDLNFKEKTDTVDNFSDITNWIKQKDDIHHGSSILVWHHNENIIWFFVSPWKCNSSEIFAYVDVRINSFIF